MNVLVTGSAGFVAGYLIEELLAHGHTVIGIDNFSKYGPSARSERNDERFRFVEGDAKDVELMTALANDAEHIVACAARIGGISYFHEFAYDLLAENERILATTFDAALDAFSKGKLERITVLSSSMVFENATTFPTPEGHQSECPPPASTYGFQKLACEYFAHGAWEQYQLPYTIVRPFNCVGVGERRALSTKDVLSGDIKLAMSHVVPDLVMKCLKGQDPLRVLGMGDQVRCYTYGGDLAKGIVQCMFDPRALNEDFNLSTPTATTVLELARSIWERVHRADDRKPFRWESDPPYPHDVQQRVPDVTKAATVLGFHATTGLGEVLDEVIPWVRDQIELGTL